MGTPTIRNLCGFGFFGFRGRAPSASSTGVQHETHRITLKPHKLRSCGISTLGSLGPTPGWYHLGVGKGGPGWKSKNSKEPRLPCTRDRPRAERPLEEDPELSPNCWGHSHPSPRSPLASQMPPPGPQTVDGMPARRWDPPRPSARVLFTECVCICRSTVFLLFCRREGPPPPDTPASTVFVFL